MNKTTKTTSLGLAALLGVALTTPAAMGDDDPTDQPDGSWLSLSGTVVDTMDDAFRLDYGPAVIKVEVDDWDRYDESTGILTDDKVTVYGRIDKGLYERKSIEAGSVYDENLGTYFYANDTDEEELAAWVATTPIVIGDLKLTGRVKSIDGREMILAPGVQVDTSELTYNPLDDKGFQQIDVGDRVQVSGPIDTDLFERDEIMADWVVNLTPTKNEDDS